MCAILDTTMSEQQQQQQHEEEEPPKKLLPCEIIEEILTRLPAKSLVRFRCVSKSFLNLTKTPQFMTSHFNKSQETTNYMILKDCYWNIYSIDCNSCDQLTKLDPPWRDCVQCLSSCDGFLCVEDVKGFIYLWNPCTKEHMRINGGIDHTCCREDSGSSYGLGFGYNSVLKDYEIVKLVCNTRYNCRSDLSVYNVKMGEWLVTENVPYKVRYMREGIFVNGAIHWIGASRSGLSNIVIAYDIGVRKFQEMKFPSCENVNWINVSVLDGCLCVLCDCDSHVEVWVMKEYGVEESWVLMFAAPELKNYVGVTVKGEFLLQETSGGLCLYDPLGQNLRDVVTDDTTQYLSLGTRFVDSLLPLPRCKSLRDVVIDDTPQYLNLGTRFEDRLLPLRSKQCSERNRLHQKLSHLSQQTSVRPFKVASAGSESYFGEDSDENDECSSSPGEDELDNFVNEGDGNTCKQVQVAGQLDDFMSGGGLT